MGLITEMKSNNSSNATVLIFVIDIHSLWAIIAANRVYFHIFQMRNKFIHDKSEHSKKQTALMSPRTVPKQAKYCISAPFDHNAPHTSIQYPIQMQMIASQYFIWSGFRVNFNILLIMCKYSNMIYINSVIN